MWSMWAAHPDNAPEFQGNRFSFCRPEKQQCAILGEKGEHDHCGRSAKSVGLSRKAYGDGGGLYVVGRKTKVANIWPAASVPPDAVNLRKLYSVAPLIGEWRMAICY